MREFPKVTADDILPMIRAPYVDKDSLAAWIADASALVQASTLWESASDDIIRMVVCACARRAYKAMWEDVEDLKQSSTTVGSFSQSLTFASASGGVYLLDREIRLLGGRRDRRKAFIINI